MLVLDEFKVPLSHSVEANGPVQVVDGRRQPDCRMHEEQADAEVSPQIQVALLILWIQLKKRHGL